MYGGEADRANDARQLVNRARGMARAFKEAEGRKPAILVATKGGPANQAGIAFRVPADGKRHVVALRVFAGLPLF